MAEPRVAPGPSSPDRVELIDGPGEGPAAVSTGAVIRRGPGSRPLAVVLGMVVVVIVGLVLVSGAGSGPASDSGSNSGSGSGPVSTVADRASPTTVPAAASSVPPTTLSPTLADGSGQPGAGSGLLPPGLPGVLTGFDVDGSVIIGLGGPDPVEVPAGLVGPAGEEVHGLGLGGAEPLWFGVELALGRSSFATRADGGDPAAAGVVDLGLLGFDDQVLFARRSEASQTANLVSLNGLGTVEDANWRWDLPGTDPRILGLWQGQLVVHQAGRTWLVAAAAVRPAPAPLLVAEGPVLGFDGANLVRLRCDEPWRCSLVVGPPDDPDRHLVGGPDLPPPIGPIQWTDIAAVSPDGTAIAAAVRFGVETKVLFADLVTGEWYLPVEPVSSEGPMAWSPDSRWLARHDAGDLVIHQRGGQQTWRLPLQRQLRALIWG